MEGESGVPSMDEDIIRDRVESLVGKNSRILDCEKKSSLVTEEVLLINGQPVRLIGEAGERIKAALKAGLPPPPEVLSEILQRAGIEKAPVEVETTMSVKSNTKTSEVSTLTDSRGQLLDEKMKEFEEADEFESTNVELWEKEPQHLTQQFEKERNRMMDYFKRFQPHPNQWKGSDESNQEGNESGERTFTSSTDYSTKSHISQEEQTPKSRPSWRSQDAPSPPPPTTPQGTKGQHPGRMPHLSPPSNPNVRPPIAPKPAQYGLLRREKNFQLPVRVVYETFI